MSFTSKCVRVCVFASRVCQSENQMFWKDWFNFFFRLLSFFLDLFVVTRSGCRFSTFFSFFSLFICNDEDLCSNDKNMRKWIRFWCKWHLLGQRIPFSAHWHHGNRIATSPDKPTNKTYIYEKRRQKMKWKQWESGWEKVCKEQFYFWAVFRRGSVIKLPVCQPLSPECVDEEGKQECRTASAAKLLISIKCVSLYEQTDYIFFEVI